MTKTNKEILKLWQLQHKIAPSATLKQHLISFAKIIEAITEKEARASSKLTYTEEDVEKVAEYLWQSKRKKPFSKTWCSWNGVKRPLFQDEFRKKARSLLSSLNLKSEQDALCQIRPCGKKATRCDEHAFDFQRILKEREVEARADGFKKGYEKALGNSNCFQDGIRQGRREMINEVRKKLLKVHKILHGWQNTRLNEAIKKAAETGDK